MRRGAALHDLGIIEDGSVLIQDGVITQVGTSRRIENLKEARGALEIAANGHVVMPAFVDAHLDLNVHDPADVPEGLPKRRALTKFYEESLALTRACLQHGTLTAEVKASAGSGNIQADAAVIKQLLKIGNNPIGLIRTWRIADMLADRADALEEFQRMLVSLIKKKLIVNTEIDSDLATSPVLGALHDSIQAAGIGMKLYANRWLAIRFDLRDYLMVQEAVAVERVTNNIVGVLGLSLFLPGPRS